MDCYFIRPYIIDLNCITLRYNHEGKGKVYSNKNKITLLPDHSRLLHISTSIKHISFTINDVIFTETLKYSSTSIKVCINGFNICTCIFYIIFQ
jgi:hypothetical protein